MSVDGGETVQDEGNRGQDQGEGSGGMKAPMPLHLMVAKSNREILFGGKHWKEVEKLEEATAWE